MGKFASLLEGLDVPDLFHISKPGHPVQLSVPLINLLCKNYQYRFHD